MPPIITHTSYASYATVPPSKSHTKNFIWIISIYQFHTVKDAPSQFIFALMRMDTGAFAYNQ